MPAAISVLRPVPRADPPFDDERQAQPPRDEWGVQGCLALDFHLPNGLPAAPRLPRQLRLISGIEGQRPDGPPVPGDADGGGLPWPDPHRWTIRLAQALGEVLTGQRPVQQMLRWTNHTVYTEVCRRARFASAAGRAAPAGAVPRVRVRSARVTRPASDVVEAAAVIEVSGRVRAMALRLEAHRERWRCTVLSVI